MAIDETLAADILVKCGRRCCICRRFRPTQLQVHHIVEQSKGGSDEPDNLISLCLTCHVDVHSKVPFTRRFSVVELKQHRDALIDMLGRGVLPNDEPDDIDLGSLVMRAAHATAHKAEGLSHTAIEVLLEAVRHDGEIIMYGHLGGFTFRAGQKLFQDGPDARGEARLRAAMEELLTSDLVQARGYKGEVFMVTNDGYLLGDELLALGGSSENSHDG